MKLRYLFIILALLVMSPFALLLLGVYTGTDVRFMIEVAVVVAIIYLVFFYRRVVRPLDTIADGIDLLSAQDFSSNLNKGGAGRGRQDCGTL